MSKIIEIKNLSFKYGNEVLFDNVNLSVDSGDFIALVGSNGTGKSTLVKLLLGELVSENGAISLWGQEVAHFKKWKNIAYVPQNGLTSNSNFPASVEEIVQANLASEIGLFRFPKKEHKMKTQHALELVGMKDYSKRLIGDLSGGQLQRVLLARALVGDPEMMILDEPITGLDERTVQSFYELLLEFNKKYGLSILMVTHDINRAYRYVTRTLCLEDGSLIELSQDEIVEELGHKHKHPMIHGGKIDGNI